MHGISCIIVVSEKERFEILMEDMEKKFDTVIEGLISLRDDFKELKGIVTDQKNVLNDHELRLKVLEEKLV